jgi:hypothetical protein
MRSQCDFTGLIKFLAREDWKSRFEEVMGEHLGPAMRAFDLEYEEIGEALGGGWNMTLWGVAFEDFSRPAVGSGQPQLCRRISEAPRVERIGSDQGLDPRLARLDHEPLRSERDRSRAILPRA